MLKIVNFLAEVNGLNYLLKKQRHRHHSYATRKWSTSSPVSIQTQSLENFTQQTQAPANRNVRSKQWQTVIGCLPTQALAFLAFFVYATHATQAIAFEWKPGFSHKGALNASDHTSNCKEECSKSNQIV